jgi:hypothetical protein
MEAHESYHRCSEQDRLDPQAEQAEDQNGGTMHRRTIALVLLCALLTVCALGAAACGSSSGTTSTTGASTTAAPVSSTTMPAAPTTAAGSTSTTAAEGDYAAKMVAWVTGVLQKLDTSSLSLSDPANASAAQLDAISTFLGQARAALAQLKAIAPPASAATAHNQFIKGFEDLIAATDSTVKALKSQSLTDLSAAMEAITTAEQELETAVAALGPIIGMTPPSS